MTTTITTLLATLIGGTLTLFGLYLNNTIQSNHEKQSQKEQVEQTLMASRFRIIQLLRQRTRMEWKCNYNWLLKISTNTRVFNARQNLTKPTYQRNIMALNSGNDQTLLRVLDAAQEDLDSVTKMLETCEADLRKNEDQIAEAVHTFHLQLAKTLQLFPNKLEIISLAKVLTSAKIISTPTPDPKNVELSVYRIWAQEKYDEVHIKIKNSWELPLDKLLELVAAENRPILISPELPHRELRLISFAKCLLSIWSKVIK